MFIFVASIFHYLKKQKYPLKQKAKNYTIHFLQMLFLFV